LTWDGQPHPGIMDDVNNPLAGPPLPDWYLLPATLIFAAITLYVAARTKGRAPRFLILACWFRYTLSSLQGYSYREAFPGMSWIALGSIITIVAGLLVLEKRRFFAKAIAVPVGGICGAIALSAIINQDMSSIMQAVLRFLFFAVICVATWQSLETAGSTVLRRLLVVFIPPIVAQIVSIVLNVPKSGELDGSVSYIGGFYHEQIFSLVMATCFVTAIFATSIGRLQRVAVALISLIAVYLANYRTTIVALAPLTMFTFAMGVPQSFRKKQRALVIVVVGLFGMAMIAFGTTAYQDRFSDLTIVAEQGTNLIQPPELFKDSDRKVLSARPYIWSQYIYAYKKAPKAQRIVGFGPDSWIDVFPEYAHNTLISFLYETGIVGVGAILILWMTMFRLAFAAEPPVRGQLIAAHLSFFVLNMATMPHSQIEGNILYGILCGFTLAKAHFAKARVNLETARIRRGFRTPQPGFASASHMRSR
jgi:hypothetical protein